MKFCSNCGKPVRFAVPDGDHKLRCICDACNIVHYENPRMIVGCLPYWEDRVLLCKRANDPRKGMWTLPAGFLENGETVEEGAARETTEEAHADVDIERLLSLYSIPAIGQVYAFFLARLKNLSFRPGTETEKILLLAESEIPWDEIAFSSVRFTLEKFFAHRNSLTPSVFIGSYAEEFNTVR